MVDPKDYEGKCNQTDIQEQWKPDKGDHVWDKDKECDGRVTEYHPWHLNEKPRESNLSIDGILYKVESDGPPFARFVWLPTAAQLKQMVNFDQQDFVFPGIRNGFFHQRFHRRDQAEVQPAAGDQEESQTNKGARPFFIPHTIPPAPGPPPPEEAVPPIASPC